MIAPEFVLEFAPCSILTDSIAATPLRCIDVAEALALEFERKPLLLAVSSLPAAHLNTAPALDFRFCCRGAPGCSPVNFLALLSTTSTCRSSQVVLSVADRHQPYMQGNVGNIMFNLGARLGGGY